MKKYFLGPNAANFLANQMRNQGASTEEPVLHRGRVSGSIIPFKITGDWEQRNGESVYSCIAHEVFFDGTNYVTDQESLDFFLYSPIHLSEKPDNAVGDIIFAVLRGNNWEIIGGGGGGVGGETGYCSKLSSTLTKNNPAYTTMNHLVYAPNMMDGRAMVTGTVVSYSKKRLDISGLPSECYVLESGSIYANQPSLPAPVITNNAENKGFSVTSPVSLSSALNAQCQIYYNALSALPNLVLSIPGSATNTPPYPVMLLARIIDTNNIAEISPLSMRYIEGTGALNISLSVSQDGKTGTLQLPSAIPPSQLSLYAIQFRWTNSSSTEPTSSFTTYKNPIAIPATSSSNKHLWVRLVFSWNDTTYNSSALYKGEFTQ